MSLTLAGDRPPSTSSRRPKNGRQLVGRAAARRRRRAESAVGWSFVAPASFIVLGLSLFPAAWAFLLSRQKWNGFAPARDAGWDNYSRMTQDPDLLGAVQHTLLFTALFVPSSIFIGMLLAVALNRPIRFVGFYRTCIFVPFVASAAATGILGTYVFNPQFGVANNILRVLHIPAQGFLEDPRQAMVIIALMSLWQQLAFTVVVYLAALQDIPQDLVEAATVDGASGRQVFRYIVIPELVPVTVFATIWQTITALQIFDLVFISTKGGPLDSTQTVVYYLWDLAFRQLRFGYGSAVAYGLFAVTLLITLGMIAYSRRAKFEAF